MHAPGAAGEGTSPAALPPAALRDWRYPTIPIVAAVLVFFLHRYVRAIPAAVQVLDAAGLALFAVAGVAFAGLALVGEFDRAAVAQALAG